MRYDRRVAQRPDYLFFRAKKIELLRLSSKISLCLRKKKIRNRNGINAVNLSNNDFIHELVQHDDAYHILKRVVDRESITSAETLTLQYAEKSRLIQFDPVTYARYFNYRYQEQRKLWDFPGGPFEGKAIAHSCYRVEFQQRRSPHIHQLLWLSDVPVFDTVPGQNELEICSLIDRFIACSSTVDHQDQEGSSYSPHFLEFLCQRHAATCGKRWTGKCRFGIPFYPKHKTQILRPLLEKTDEQEHERLARVLKRIKGVLTENENLPHIGAVGGASTRCWIGKNWRNRRFYSQCERHIQPGFKGMVQPFGLKTKNADSATTIANPTLDITCGNLEIVHGTCVSLTSFHEPIWTRCEVPALSSIR
ncbi:unnamed protein product [Gongylonema pulchrum]|uniref:Helitron_like_N domain-containing protein n=1 Tax=Gongylonema pulchrum TaxID=637853 RepID=A0A183E410_9BILA|nr:unnamed protein product [Gongylonema pulchrum]